MNRLLCTFFTALIACSVAQALDIKTDAACKKLVTAIDQGQNVETCKTAWHKITASTTVTAQDQAVILAQALQLAQEKKVTLEQELANLGDETKDRSKIKWGVGQLALGTYLAMGEVILLQELLTGVAIRQIPTWRFWWPDMWILDKKWVPEIPNIIFCISRLFALNPIIGIYSLHKGYKNLREGLNHKQILQEKISNLDATIIYLQDLQTNHH